MENGTGRDGTVRRVEAVAKEIFIDRNKQIVATLVKKGLNKSLWQSSDGPLRLNFVTAPPLPAPPKIFFFFPPPAGSKQVAASAIPVQFTIP